jgi:cytochrome c556
MKRNATAAAMVLGLAVAGLGIAAAQTPDDIIAQRQAGYKHIGQLFGAMKKGIDARADVTQFAGPAQEIAAWGEKIPTLFPDGTQKGHDTHAKPEIWSDRAEFDQKAKDLVAQAGKLVQAAQSGDKGAFAAQWKATGAACGACHEKFRYRYT